MRNSVGIFGVTAGVIVVALVARYGFATSDTRLDGAIAAFFFGVIAVGGIGGPAVAVHLFRSSEGWAKTWGVIAGAIAAVALLANLSNSLGAIAGRADKTIAERTNAKDASKDARDELARLARDREALPAFTPATADDVQAAREAVAATERGSAAECEKRGPRCREREATERAARDALAVVLANKGLTDRAVKVDTDAAAARSKLEKTPAVAAVNPMAETLARIFHMEADAAATWQQVATVIVVELLIAFALIAYELLGFARHGASAGSVQTPELTAAETPHATASAAELPPLDTSPAPAELKGLPLAELVAAAIPVPRQRRSRKPLAVVKSDRVPGDVAKFAVARLRPAVGASVTITALYQPYLQWCEQRSFRAVSRERFEELFAALCDLSGFTRSQASGEPCCLNLELAA